MTARRESNADPATDAISDYLRRIARTRLLTAVEEVDLAQRIEAGLSAATQLPGGRPVSTELVRDLRLAIRDGERARVALLEANLRLVVSVAKRFTGRGLAFLDLIQEGNIGLIRAVEKFDYARGYKFSTYATWWIRQALRRALADQSRVIRIPVHVVEQINQIASARRELVCTLGHEPTTEEQAEDLGLTVARLESLQRLTREPLSLDHTLGPDQDARLGDLIEDTGAVVAIDALSAKLLHRDIRAMLDALTEREAGIIALRFGFINGTPHTPGEISQVYGVTPERIRQIERQTMTKLRNPSRCRRLRGYLDHSD